MNYDAFCAGRDMFYAACMVAGSAAGLFAGAFRRDKTPRDRSRRVTASLYAASAGVALAGAALCVSEYVVFYAGALVTGGALAALFFVAFFFPAALRFALCALLSLLILSACYFYAVGSAFDGGNVPVARVTYSGGGSLTVKNAYNHVPVFARKGRAENGLSVFYDKRYTNTLKYSLAYIEAGRIMPVFGGLRRVILLSVSVDQAESGRSIPVFSAKPMEETLLGRLMGKRAEALTSASDRAFRPGARGLAALQIIYGRAKIPAPGDGGHETLALKLRHGVWREEWARE